MKRVLILLSFYSFSLAAIESMVTANSKDTAKPQAFSQRSFEFSASYNQSSIKSTTDSGHDFNAKGVSLSLGKIFHLNPRFTTTAALIGHYQRVDANLNSQVDSGNENISSYDVGLNWQVAYNLPYKKIILRPFIDASATLGKWNSDYSYHTADYSYIFEQQVPYNRYSIGIGVQFLLPKGITPFIKYSFSRIQKYATGSQYSEIQSSTTSNYSLQEDYTLKSNERTLNAQAVYLGIGYFL